MSDFDLRQGVSRRLEELGSRSSSDSFALRSPVDFRPVRRFRAAAQETAERESAGEAGAEPALLHAMVLGVDESGPRPLSREEIGGFGDFFTANLVLEGRAPLTLQALLDDLDALPAEVRLQQRSVFVVAEGASLAAGHPDVDPNTRLVVVWRRAASARPDLMLSTVPVLDDPTALMQVIAWSESQGAFHFFERARDGSGWMWAGNSWHALERPSRGRGPFDSHVNGSLVMKELKFPWVHWHSMSNAIRREQVLGSEELRQHPLLRRFDGAEALEDVVKGGVRRWTARRIAAETVGGRLRNLNRYARQLTTTTTVNLVSSPVAASVVPTTDRMELPVTFFLDLDGLDGCARQLTDGEPLPVADRSVSTTGRAYADASAELGMHVVDTAGNRFPGDTQFAFVVPERAFEDVAVVDALLARQVLSPRLVLCTLMVDFPNPVFSARRARLLRRFPDSAAVGSGGQQLDAAVAAAVRADAEAGSPEAEFLRWWDEPGDLLPAVTRTVDRYLTQVRDRLADPAGVRDVLRLAESRKKAFRRRPLAEFRPTVSRLDGRVGALRMTEDGAVVAANTESEE